VRERTGWAGDRHCTAAALLASTLILSGRRAEADPVLAEASFLYERQPGAEQCPAEPAIREQVALRLGYYPFRDGAARRVTVSLQPGAHGLSAHITTENARAGELAASRDIDSEGTGCDELAQAVVLAVSLAIDPMSMTRPRSPHPLPVTSPSVTRPDSPPAARVETVHPAASRGWSPWTTELSAQFRIGYGIVPTASVGPVAELRFVDGRLALLAEAGADVAVGTVNGVSASVLRGGAGVCGRVIWHFSACGRVDLGELEGTNSARGGKTDSQFYADIALGPRLDLPIWGDVHLVAAPELLAPLVPIALSVNGARVWSTGVVAGALEIGVGYRF